MKPEINPPPGFSPMLEQISTWLKMSCPFSIGVGLTDVDLLAAAPPAPSDIAAVPDRFAPRRRRTFLLGRAAARMAMVDLKLEPVHIERSDAGLPIWPPGFLGSISHTDDTAVAVMVSRSAAAGIGVDLEELGRPIAPNTLEMVLTPEERTRSLSGDSVVDGQEALRIFCAKETAFKALAAFLPRDVGFWQITLRPDDEDGQFIAVANGFDGVPKCIVKTAVVTNYMVAFGVVHPEQDRLG